jgi:hypothetical protein
LIKLCKTPAGLGKYGIGSRRKPEVITSQPQTNKTATVKIGRIWRIRARKRAQPFWVTAVTMAIARKRLRKTV